MEEKKTDIFSTVLLIFLLCKTLHVHDWRSTRYESWEATRDNFYCVRCSKRAKTAAETIRKKRK